MKKLSIIVPNYNNSQYISKCLDSVVNQTYKNLEIIIIDDCSTDNSIEIIKKYQKFDSRIKFLVNEINYGVSKTRDIGINHATSEWITTLDSDDYYYCNEKIEKEMRIILDNNFKDTIVYSGIVHVDSSCEVITKIMNSKNTKVGNLFEDIITRNCAIPRDFIFSKKLYEDVGGYDYDIPLYEDWDLKIRLSKEARFFFTGLDGIAYRRHQNGLSSTNQERHKKWVSFIFKKNTKDIDNKYELETNLRKNFNFNEALSLEKKNKIVTSLVQQIKDSNFHSFSIWGIGELTNLLLIELSLQEVNKKINFIIDSRANQFDLTFHSRSVVLPKFALNQGEKNYILASYNNKDKIEKALKEAANNLKLTNLIILKI